MTKVQALVTVVVSKDKEIKSGKEGEIDAKDAQKLSKLGFVKIVWGRKQFIRDEQSFFCYLLQMKLLE